MGKKFAVFDIDGTLVRWQLYHAIVSELASQGVLGPGVHEQIIDARKAWKHRQHPEAFRTYELELLHIYEAALQKVQLKDFDKAVSAVLKEHKQQVYTYTRDLLKDLKKRGFFLLAISGSHLEIVELLAKYYGFDDWIGTIYERNGKGFTGKVAPGAHNKDATLKKFITKHGLAIKDSVGVGDSMSDAAFLAIVEQPIAFNPDRQLFAEAKKHGWKIVVERKNMVYELEAKDGSYLLA